MSEAAKKLAIGLNLFYNFKTDFRHFTNFEVTYTYIYIAGFVGTTVLLGLPILSVNAPILPLPGGRGVRGHLPKRVCAVFVPRRGAPHQRVQRHAAAHRLYLLRVREAGATQRSPLVCHPPRWPVHVYHGRLNRPPGPRATGAVRYPEAGRKAGRADKDGEARKAGKARKAGCAPGRRALPRRKSCECLKARGRPPGATSGP